MSLGKKKMLSQAGGFVPSDNFNTVLYPGNGGTQSVTGVGFAPDFVWIKRRDDAIGNTNNLIFDSVRGAGKRIMSNHSNTESTETDELTSFNSNGFTVGADASTNGSNGSIVSWNWKAGGNSNTYNKDGTGYSTASAAGLTTGSLTPTGASVNTTSGFSIIKLNSGSSTADVTVSHGLGVKPSFVLFKKLNSDGGGWFTWSVGLSPESYYLYLNDNYGVGNLGQSGNIWGNQSFTSDVISFRSGYTVETNRNVVIYAWAEIPGYSKMGTYTWTGSSNTAGTMVTGLGFEPSFVMIKGINLASDWQMYDNKRVSGTQSYALYADLADAEVTTGYQGIGFDSNGFSAIVGDDGNTTSSGSLNQQGQTYIYMAFA